MTDKPYSGACYPDPQSTYAKSYPDDNPKTAVGVTKVPLHLVPPVLYHHTAMAFADGARKYGPYNWRDKTVSSSVYVGAALRHLNAWWDGEDLSEDARVHHLGHVAACVAILLDAMSVNKLNDDRPTKGAAAQLQKEFAENGRKLPTDAVPASDLQIPLFPMEGRLESSRDVGRNRGSVHNECRYSEAYLSGIGRRD
jgi:hypothetical protein